MPSWPYVTGSHVTVPQHPQTAPKIDDRLSSILINLIFSVFLFPRGVRGELEKEKLLIRYRNNCQFLL